MGTAMAAKLREEQLLGSWKPISFTGEQEAKVVEAALAGTACYETIAMAMLSAAPLSVLTVSYAPAIMSHEFSALLDRLGVPKRRQHGRILMLYNGSTVRFTSYSSILSGHATRGYIYDLAWFPSEHEEFSDRVRAKRILFGCIR